MKNINRLFKVIDNSLFMTTGQLDYDRITDAIIKLSNAVHSFEGDTEEIWYIGEHGNCCLSDLIVGAYWHYTEYHGGQYSKGYAALCALGQVFNPNMSGAPDPDCSEYIAYESLNDMANNQ